jgi:predicted PurR-regulated permease PerM
MLRYKEYFPLLISLFLIVISIFLIKPFFLAISLGAILAYLFFPLYRFFRKKIKNKTFSALIVCILIMAVLTTLGGFFVNTLVKEAYVFYIVGKQKLATGFFRNCHNHFCLSLKNLGQDPAINYHLQDSLKIMTNWIVMKGSNILISIPRMALNLFVTFFTMFYFLRDRDIIVSRLNDFLGSQKNKYAIVFKRFKEIIHGVIYGYLIVAVIQGSLGALGFYLFGIPSPLLWGMIMALLALVPFFGTGLVWIPASLFMLLDGVFQDSGLLMVKAVGLFVYGAIIISGLDNFLKPKLIGEKAKVHPVVILLGIFGGIFMFGPLGVILGPLFLSLSIVFIKTFLVMPNTFE